MLFLLAITAHAGSVVDWTEDFDRFGQRDFSGTDGWVSGYSADDWRADDWWNSGVSATRDDNGGDYGKDDPVDNHLVKMDRVWADHIVDARMITADDDAMGLVFRYQDDRNYYLAFFSHDGAPGLDKGGRDTVDGGRLYRISGGRATELARTGTTYRRAVPQQIRVVALGDQLEVWLDRDLDGFQSGERLMTATDTTFSSGRVGFYSYDNAGSAFDDLVVSLSDRDDDGIPDDGDNCPDIANGGQADRDGDGLGNPCDDDRDGDGADRTSDCDDFDPTVHPGADEVCDGVDQDCDAVADDDPVDGLVWYADTDSDGFGDPGAEVLACDPPEGTVDDDTDCDDGDDTVHPAADEHCDGLDEDCDDDVDEDPVDPGTWYLDTDGDGHGDPLAPSEACAPGDDEVASSDDCDDTDPDVHPGATEIPADGIDNDCDGSDAAPLESDRSWHPPPDEADTPPSGCGCATGDRPGWVVLLLGILALRRRSGGMLRACSHSSSR